MKIKLLLASLSVLLLCACNDGGGKPEIKDLGKVDIMDARALYLVGSQSTRFDNEKKELFKIDYNGGVSSVSFKDKDGGEMTDDIDVLHLEKLSDEYILIIGRIHYLDGKSYSSATYYWIVRKSDGAAFDIGEIVGYDIVVNCISEQRTMAADSDGNLYWIGQNSDKKSVFKMSSSGGGGLTATVVSGDFTIVNWFSLDNRDGILMRADGEWIYRSADGRFMRIEKDESDFDYRFKYYLPVRESPDGGFIFIESDSDETNIIKLTPDMAGEKTVITEITVIGRERNDFRHREDLANGGYIFSTYDYKDYIYISPSGEVEWESHEAGFAYPKRETSNNCVYGIEGNSTIHRMNIETRVMEQVFSDSRFRIDSYKVAPDDSYIDIFALRYSDARKVMLRVSDGDVSSEQTQSEDAGEIITFIRLN